MKCNNEYCYLFNMVSKFNCDMEHEESVSECLQRHDFDRDFPNGFIAGRVSSECDTVLAREVASGAASAPVVVDVEEARTGRSLKRVFSFDGDGWYILSIDIGCLEILYVRGKDVDSGQFDMG